MRCVSDGWPIRRRRDSLSHGPRSRTYKGADPISQRSFALKTIARHLLDEGRIARLRQEIASAGRLDHRSIVKVFEYGEDSEWAYVAMEFVEGWPLRNGRLRARLVRGHFL
jgi:eukaryotic-like serine/threonine-protein kinase